MSARLSLLALPTLLLLGACDGNPLRTAAGKADCCCSHCPATAAAATAPGGPTRAGGVIRAASGGEARTYRVRTPPVVTGGGYRYESTEASGYGGRYGARGGRAYGGVSVSVTESESSSSRYSYSESSSGYAYGLSSGGGVGYAGGGAYGPGGARVSSDPPHYPGYRAAQTDRDGYLTWPGKVED